jgi:opacity protein-like surface antigen
MRGNRSYRHCARVLILGFCLLFALVLAPKPAAAEWAADFYVGPNFPDGEEDDGVATAGARGGYWFVTPAKVDIGLYLDASVVESDFASGDYTLVPISGLAMLRFRLLDSKDFPNGRIHPYVGAGPSGFYSDIDFGSFSDDSWDPGLDVRAGLSGMIWPHIGLFAEYRYTYFEPEYSDVLVGSVRVQPSDEVKFHHVLFGLAFRF